MGIITGYIFTHRYHCCKLQSVSECGSNNTIILAPIGAQNTRGTMGPTLFEVRIELLAHHSSFPELDALRVLVPYKYDHRHARLCGVGAPYTSRKCPLIQLLWHAARGPVRNIPSVLDQRSCNTPGMGNPE